MSNGRNGKKAKDRRISGPFVALPVSVLDSPAFLSLGYPAKSLLIELARQDNGRNNGRMLTSAKYLKTRGWNSSAVITRAKRELLEAGFIHETVQGHRPNKASWYAITWQMIDDIKGYDAGALETFKRGAFMSLPVVAPKPTRDELYQRWDAAGAKNDPLVRMKA
jgi:hypothetical protein